MEKAYAKFFICSQQLYCVIFWDFTDEEDTSLGPTPLFPGTQIAGDTDTSGKILNGVTTAISAICHRQPGITEMAWPWDLIPAWTLAHHRPLASFLSVKWECWSISGVGKLQPTGRIQSITSFYMACELRIVFTRLKKIQKKVTLLGHMNMMRNLNFSVPK